jgi:hypothetical protein
VRQLEVELPGEILPEGGLGLRQGMGLDQPDNVLHLMGVATASIAF